MIKRWILRSALLLFSSTAFAQATVIPMGTDVNDPNNSSDTEPSIAVNPTNPLDIVVLAFSDNWGPGNNASIWRSSDGGNTWAKSTILPQPGANLFGPADQKVAFDRFGHLFVAELGAFPITDFVYRQTGAAATPLTVGAAFGDDQPQVDVDRSAAGMCAARVYAPWLNTTLANAQSNVTNSSNGGVTVTNVAVGNNATFQNRTTRVALGPDGSAYIVYKTREGAAGGMFENAHFRVDRSDNCGASWGANAAGGVSVHGAATVPTLFTNSFGNAAKGKVTRARSSDAWIAVSQGTGDVYAAYVNRDVSGFAQIYAARSTDRGVTWTTSRVTNGANHSGFPEIAVTDNGTVGVLYIDFDDSGTSTLFRHRFARSFDHGASWSDEILQTLDPSTVPNATNGFIFGDYEGLTAQGTMFYGAFTGEGSGRSTTQMDPVFFRETGVRVIGPPDTIRGPVIVQNSGCRMTPENFGGGTLTTKCVKISYDESQPTSKAIVQHRFVMVPSGNLVFEFPVISNISSSVGHLNVGYEVTVTVISSLGDTRTNSGDVTLHGKGSALLQVPINVDWAESSVTFQIALTREILNGPCDPNSANCVSAAGQFPGPDLSSIPLVGFTFPTPLPNDAFLVVVR
jgi:hypothetical protein